MKELLIIWRLTNQLIGIGNPASDTEAGFLFAVISTHENSTHIVSGTYFSVCGERADCLPDRTL